ncbi:hypothetical protein GWK47_054160 [Chionoecetes opilio]|uniref:Uncharacterized protein n=1 Tax=Chionoecetes opilio TaxID=41210 RepID=A0A8J4Y000_CHIOP|nr:hypothetical protein GWK47_054160 [Chionoecetes opilio]
MGDSRRCLRSVSTNILCQSAAAIYSPRKILHLRQFLLVDNAGGQHFTALNLDHPNVCVSYLPQGQLPCCNRWTWEVIKTMSSALPEAVGTRSTQRMEGTTAR